jgi:hypothetical protein
MVTGHSLPGRRNWGGAPPPYAAATSARRWRRLSGCPEWTRPWLRPRRQTAPGTRCHTAATGCLTRCQTAGGCLRCCHTASVPWLCHTASQARPGCHTESGCHIATVDSRTSLEIDDYSNMAFQTGTILFARVKMFGQSDDQSAKRDIEKFKICIDSFTESVRSTFKGPSPEPPTRCKIGNSQEVNRIPKSSFLANPRTD